MTPWTVATCLLWPWDFPGKNTGVGSHSLLQGIFPTQGSNPGLLHCRQIFYRLRHQGNPRTLGFLGLFYEKQLVLLIYIICIFYAFQLYFSYLLHRWLKALFISQIKASPFPVGVNKEVHSRILGPCSQPAKSKEKRKGTGLEARLQAAEQA